MSRQSAGESLISKNLTVFTDGASRGNPGDASIGVVVKDDQGKVLQTISEYLGIATNNSAEYRALIRGLECVQTFRPDQVDFYLDSQLVVRQMTGVYKIKHKGIIPLAKKVQVLCRQLLPGRVHFYHIPREKNREADALANEALDKR